MNLSTAVVYVNFGINLYSSGINFEKNQAIFAEIIHWKELYILVWRNLFISRASTNSITLSFFSPVGMDPGSLSKAVN